jgi:aerobic C4-dicarboxylate transport protein
MSKKIKTSLERFVSPVKKRRSTVLSVVPDIPIQSTAILVGIDKFMSECRALTNLIGNGVACVVISLSESELDKDKLHETMAHPIELGEALDPGAGEPAAPPSSS